MVDDEVEWEEEELLEHLPAGLLMGSETATKGGANWSEETGCSD